MFNVSGLMVNSQSYPPNLLQNKLETQAPNITMSVIAINFCIRLLPYRQVEVVLCCQTRRQTQRLWLAPNL